MSGPDRTTDLVDLSTGASRTVPALDYGEIPIWLDRGLLMTGRLPLRPTPHERDGRTEPKQQPVRPHPKSSS